MRTVYVVDNKRVFTGEVKTIDLATPIKKNWLLTEPPAGPGYHIWDGVKWFTRDQYPYDPPPPPNTKMTHLTFLRRFTPEERTALRNAATTDPILDDAMYLFEQAKEIDTTDEDTVNFVNYMVSQTLLDSARVSEILAPVTDEEV
jgi:hypothetical protein